MVKVIGQAAQFVKQATCRKCAAVLEYTDSEVRPLHRGTDYSGGSDGSDGFNCPQCGNEVRTRSW